jgi:hypothetical protein
VYRHEYLGIGLRCAKAGSWFSGQRPPCDLTVARSEVTILTYPVSRLDRTHRVSGAVIMQVVSSEGAPVGGGENFVAARTILQGFSARGQVRRRPGSEP